MTNTAIGLLVGLLTLAGIICLQIFLSGRKNRWFGLLLPALGLGYSLVIILSVAAYAGSGWATLGMIVTVFLMSNIPTTVLLVIYFACREKYRKRAQLDRMNAQDL